MDEVLYDSSNNVSDKAPSHSEDSDLEVLPISHVYEADNAYSEYENEAVPDSLERSHIDVNI